MLSQLPYCFLEFGNLCPTSGEVSKNGRHNCPFLAVMSVVIPRTQNEMWEETTHSKQLTKTWRMRRVRRASTLNHLSFAAKRIPVVGTAVTVVNTSVHVCLPLSLSQRSCTHAEREELRDTFQSHQGALYRKKCDLLCFSVFG